MKKIVKLLLLVVCVSLPIAFAFGQSASWTDSGELVQNVFESNYRNVDAEAVAILNSSFLENAENIDVLIVVGFDSGPSCNGLSFDSVAASLGSDRKANPLGNCRIAWMSILGSESKFLFDSNMLLNNARVIADPLLGLFFLDYGTKDSSPTFLLDERSTRVSAIDLIADASVATGMDFSSANLQEVVFAHHRQEWTENERPTLVELREEVQSSLRALFGGSDQSVSTGKSELLEENCEANDGTSKTFGFCSSCRNGGPGTESCACTNSAGASCTASCFSNMYACCECGSIMRPRCTCCTSGSGGGGGVGTPSLPPLPGGPGWGGDEDEDGQ